MAKSDDATRKAQTHFEQVPVENVKKIAEQDVSKGKKVGADRPAAGPTARKNGSALERGTFNR
jgi:hypothetical protein